MAQFTGRSSQKVGRLLESIPPEVVGKRLTEKQLAKISRLVLQWEAKGSALGLTEGETEDIKEDHKNSSEMQKVAMLRKWAKKVGDEATLKNLIEISYHNGWDVFIRNVCVSLGYIEEEEGCSWKRLIVILSLLFIAALISLYFVPLREILMKLNRPFSPKFPYSRNDFVGRDQDVQKLLGWIDFSNGSLKIISIVGSPGIGKSALGIYVGNEMIRSGVVAYYVDMAEFPYEQLKQVLAEKILTNLDKRENITFDELLTWANNRWWNTIIFLDNCDECIHSQKDAFQEAIEKLLRFSGNKIKVLTASREIVLHLESCGTHHVQPLNKESACELLDLRIPSVLNVTEKVAIAELTGEVPLALQIISSLLSVGVNSPSPTQIIESLTKDPIPTLSPKNLRQSMQLNASISLSYEYLSKNLQEIGRYLAYFPGSFDKSSVFGVLPLIANINFHTEAYYFNSMNELVARSLLEVDRNSGRFHFHKLIREFFLTRSGTPEKGNFLFAYERFFSDKLCEMTSEFINSPKQALITMDIERHNVQLLITIMQDRIDLNYNHSLSCFVTALTTNYLSCRFTQTELIRTIGNVTENIEVLLNQQKIIQHDSPEFSWYIDLIIHSSILIEDMMGRAQAAKEYKKYIDTVERLKVIPGTSKVYLEFYYRMLRYQEELGEEMAMLSRVRILEANNVSTHGCTTTGTSATCNYVQVSHSFYLIHDFKNCVLCFEKALVSGVEYNYSLFEQIIFSLQLRISYHRLGNETKKEEMENYLLNAFDFLMNQSSSLVNSHYRLYSNYLQFLTNCGELNKRLAIMELIVDSMEELGKKAKIEDMHITLSMATLFFNLREYDRSVKIVNFALEIEDLMSPEYIVEHKMVKGRAMYLANNHTEANALFQDVIEFLRRSNLTLNYSRHYSDACSYLVMLWNFKYTYECYSNRIDSVIRVFFYVLLKIPLSKVLNEPTKAKDHPIEVYPPITRLSVSTDILFDHSKFLMVRQDDWPSISTSVSNVLITYLWKFFSMLLASNILRFIINFLSIYARLIFAYLFVKLYFRHYCCCMLLHFLCLFMTAKWLAKLPEGLKL